ncbi:bcl-2-related protein A1 [Canis lupus familiaris]|nr:bcl-2-related protein A1 [Canis lupus familiaris]XP_038517460.1 bcl-2-related protein A1 [Canis lupus familiaris]XP_545888.5 bcl-2-related protein A1 [Canis lupus familiaris]|eukprot:XP_545888.5 bcl-2-related protein A1 [Canis lupus familiaris]
MSHLFGGSYDAQRCSGERRLPAVGFMFLWPTPESDEEEGAGPVVHTEIPPASTCRPESHPEPRQPRPHRASGSSRGTRLPSRRAGGPRMTDCEFGYTLALAQDYVRHVLQIPQPGPAPSRASRVLQDVAFSVQGQVEKNLKPCLDSFDVVSVDTARTIFNQVMEKEFEDGVINWGRIVTVFAFEGILTKKLLEQRISSDVDAEKVSYFVAEFITRNMRDWIRQNGGWENGFVKKFEPKSGWLTFLEVLGTVCEMWSHLKQYY